jgi:hypothetical protein
LICKNGQPYPGKLRFGYADFELTAHVFTEPANISGPAIHLSVRRNVFTILKDEAVKLIRKTRGSSILRKVSQETLADLPVVDVDQHIPNVYQDPTDVLF